MKDFFGDLWQDLRERRLLPVAILLVVAIVAIPVVLTKSSSTPAAPVQTAGVEEESSAALLQADTADAASSSTGSSLSSFGSKDPFAPPKAITKARTATVAEASAAGAGATGGGTSPADGGTTGGGDGGTTPGTTEPGVPPTKTTQYQYVADVTFWNGSKRREIRGLRKLDMLPNQASPVLIFMGTTGDGGNAVFLVDSTLSAAGEGRCVPSRGNCAFVHIGPGAEHTFTTEDGDSYRLRVDEIRRVKLSASAAHDEPSANAAVGDTDRRFMLPSLIDLVIETAPEERPAAEAASDKPSSPDAGSR